MYPCRCTYSETALRIDSALRWRKARKSQSPERVSNSHSSCAPSSAALDFSFWYRSFLASPFCTTYGESCSTEKRVCLFMCNVGNVQTIDTERTCLTSQIFRSWFRKASGGQASPALATLRQHSAVLAWFDVYAECVAVGTVARHIWKNRTKMMRTCEI